jgi:hypothetical protein
MTVLSILYSSGFSVDDLSHILKKDVCQERNVVADHFFRPVPRQNGCPASVPARLLNSATFFLPEGYQYRKITHFLKNCVHGKREALRKAQLSTKKKYPHPYYWASFQLTGNSE